MAAISYSIIKMHPFTVEYRDALGRVREVVYSERILDEEIVSEMPYVVFSEDELDAEFLYPDEGDDLLLIGL